MTAAERFEVATVIEVWQDVAILASLDREINLGQADMLLKSFGRAYHCRRSRGAVHAGALAVAHARRLRVARLCAEEVRTAIAMVELLGGRPDPEVLQ